MLLIPGAHLDQAQVQTLRSMSLVQHTWPSVTSKSALWLVFMPTQCPAMEHWPAVWATRFPTAGSELPTAAPYVKSTLGNWLKEAIMMAYGRMTLSVLHESEIRLAGSVEISVGGIWASVSCSPAGNRIYVLAEKWSQVDYFPPARNSLQHTLG